MMSPWADLTLLGKSMKTRAEADPLMTRDSLATTARLYVGTHDPRDPLASPLYADLAGLPPVRIHVGEDEVLLDDSICYGERLEAAGENGSGPYVGGHGSRLPLQPHSSGCSTSA